MNLEKSNNTTNPNWNRKQIVWCSYDWDLSLSLAEWDGMSHTNVSFNLTNCMDVVMSLWRSCHQSRHMAIVLKLLTSRLPNVIKLSKLNTLFIIFILILCAFKWGFRWLFVFSSGVLVCCRSCLLLFFVLLGWFFWLPLLMLLCCGLLFFGYLLGFSANLLKLMLLPVTVSGCHTNLFTKYVLDYQFQFAVSS